MSRVLLRLLVLSAGCSSDGNPVTPGGAAPVRVLMLTATAGFRHDSIPTARQVMATLSATTREFDVRPTEDLLDAHRRRTGELRRVVLRAHERRAAVQRGSARGHSELRLERPRIRRRPQRERHPARVAGVRTAGRRVLQGASLDAAGTVIVEDSSHPATAGLGDRFSLTEEFYTFVDNPRPSVHVLLRLDPASVGATVTTRWPGRIRSAAAGVLQRARPLFGHLERSAVSAADRRRDPVGRGTRMMYALLVHEWARVVWAAYSDQHVLAREWIDEALGRSTSR